MEANIDAGVTDPESLYSLFRSILSSAAGDALAGPPVGQDTRPEPNYQDEIAFYLISEPLFDQDTSSLIGLYIDVCDYTAAECLLILI